MSTIHSIIHRLLPDGSTNESGNIESFPLWPPDLFAVAATIVNLTGCYCRSRYATGEQNSLLANTDVLKKTRELGAAYGMFAPEEGAPIPVDFDQTAFREIQSLWHDLISRSNQEIGSADDAACDAAMQLMLIADTASEGVGFVVDPPGKLQWADFVFKEHRRSMEGTNQYLRYLPHSLCPRSRQ